MLLDLNDTPEFRALLARLDAQDQRIKQLEDALPEWVPEETARTLTGHSATTLWRLRKEGRLVWKSDHGVRYSRTSITSYNESRAIGRRTPSPLAA